jgi:hypothetical protein
MTAVFGLLVLPLAALLLAQWPLRELVQAYSRQANDAAQILFALYVAVAVTAASRSHAHLASLQPHPSGAPRPGWQAWALLACVAPWGLFMLWASWPLVAASVASFERFGETLKSGLFHRSSSPWSLLLVLVLVGRLCSNSCRTVARRARREPHRPARGLVDAAGAGRADPGSPACRSGPC